MVQGSIYSINIPAPQLTVNCISIFMHVVLRVLATAAFGSEWDLVVTGIQVKLTKTVSVEFGIHTFHHFVTLVLLNFRQIYSN